MSKTVFHTLHLSVKRFPDSLKEELERHRDDGELWYGLSLVPRINVFGLGNGLYVEFYDRDVNNDLRRRMETEVMPRLFSRANIVGFGFWPGVSIPEVTNKKSFGERVRAAEIHFSRQTSLVAV